MTASGTYDAAHQVVVVHGNGTYWVVTPLQPVSGAAIPVARATVTSLDDPAVSDVTERHRHRHRGRAALRGRPRHAVDAAGGPGRPAHGVRARPALPRGRRLGGARVADAAGGGRGDAGAAAGRRGRRAAIRLQNASYAVQWLLFAGFVVFFWSRMLRDDLRGAGPAQPRPETAPVREVY